MSLRTLGLAALISTFRRGLGRAAAALMAGAVLATALTACGGGGTVTAPAKRTLSADFASRKAVAYSPYRTSASAADLGNEVITKAQIRQDLQLVLQAGYGLIRVFDSSDKVARQTLEVIRDDGLDLKMMLGSYVQSGDAAYSNAEIARTIKLANEFPAIVVAVSVGNETMVSWSFNRFGTTAMAAYIRTVRDAIAQPVTTDDNWAFFAKAYSYEQDPAPILEVIDFVSMHTYPLLDTVFAPDLWNWRQSSVPAGEQRAIAMMDAAIARAKFEHDAVRSKMNALGFDSMPIIIGETGWKADPASVVGRSHPVNQKLYIDRLDAWKAASGGPVAIVYFEAFDEPWKQGDDKWGLFNKDRQARYAVQSKFAPAAWEPGSYTDANAVYVVSLDVRPAVTADRYTAYADTVTAGEARPALAAWNAWENNSTAAAPEVSSSSAPSDAGHSIEITPIPAVWGWGMTLPLPTNAADDLSAFSNGALNFSVKTTYPGSIEVGFYVGSGTDGSAYDAYIQIAAGDFGYQNDGNWHEVSIPIAELRQRVAAADGVALSRIDLSRVTNAFVIADRYAKTGKPQGSNVTNKISVDAIFWSK